MKSSPALPYFVALILPLAAIASALGIWSDGGPGPHTHESIRGLPVAIWGRGIYRHMSAEVAPQGIAQDYVTLFIAIPLLAYAAFKARSGRLKDRLLLTGVLGYFLVTYLFYLVMGMYNALFLVYTLLASVSFFGFLLSILSIDKKRLAGLFRPETPVKLLGGYLVAVAASIALLWLSIVVPPLLDGTIIPTQAEHYTTLIVQGLDLSILLPAAMISGILLRRKTGAGYLLAPVYLVFLSLLMTALSAKIVAMAILGFNVIPAVFIIPVFHLATVAAALITFRNIREDRLA